VELSRLIVAVLIALVLPTGRAAADPFANPNAIAISGTTTSAGSQIFVSGLGSSLTSITVQVNGLSHTLPENLGLVLVAPTGRALVLMGACGGGFAVVSPVSLIFSDGASVSLPNSTQITSGTFRPTQYAALGSFPPPGPGLAYDSPAPQGTQTLGTEFVSGNPNGIWSLYAFDPVPGGSGQISGGWSLQITASPRPVPVLPQSAIWILGALLGVTALLAGRSG
jgi:hypothetical protein